MDKPALDGEFPRLYEIPFDSDRKRMTTVFAHDGRVTVVVKGAVDVLAPRCAPEGVDGALKTAEALSQDAIRVLAVAVKEIEVLPEKPDEAELERGPYHARPRGHDRPGKTRGKARRLRLP